MQQYTQEVKLKAIGLRAKGLSYGEIAITLNMKIPKATLAYWTKDLVLTIAAKNRLKRLQRTHLIQARKAAITVKIESSLKKRTAAKKRNQHLAHSILNIDTSKIALAMLYLGEGSKTRSRASLTLGNSDPGTIRLYLKLLALVYQVDPKRLRGTVQCRADQDIAKLEKFWQQLTGIPSSQWYKAQVDPRSVGKVTKRQNYKGVCRIDYFSAEAFTDLLETITLLLV